MGEQSAVSSQRSERVLEDFERVLIFFSVWEGHYHTLPDSSGPGEALRAITGWEKERVQDAIEVCIAKGLIAGTKR